MLTLKKVAITGGLSSGKTSVCKILEKKGAYVISADAIVHKLLSPQTVIGQQIVEILGKEIVHDDQFDRNKIAKKVFGNKKNLTMLESILHPAVFKEIEKQFNQVQIQKKFTLFVAEIPLLYETESQYFFDYVVVVLTDQKIAVNRFQKKTNQPIQEFEKRMMHQLPPAKKQANANFVINNDTDFAALEKQVSILHEKLTK